LGIGGGDVIESHHFSQSILNLTEGFKNNNLLLSEDEQCSASNAWLTPCSVAADMLYYIISANLPKEKHYVRSENERIQH